MNARLPLSYWERLKRLAEPLELMKFTLIYDGDLPSAGNSPKPIPASRIRNEFHYQMADLWDSHIILRELACSARYPIIHHLTETRSNELDHRGRPKISTPQIPWRAIRLISLHRFMCQARSRASSRLCDVLST
jgi:hypothetical protein